MNSELIEKISDVKISSDTLKTLKGEFLLYSRDYDLTEYLSTDINVLERRSSLFYDTLSIEGLKAIVDSTVKTLQYISQMIRMQNNVGDEERGLYSVKQLTLYFETIDTLNEFYSQHKKLFSSEDYTAWFDNIEKIAVSEEYKTLKINTQKLLDRISSVKSISIGFNFDATLTPYEAGILSINDEYIKSGTLIDRIMRMNPRENTSLLSFAPLISSKKICGESDFDGLIYSFYTSVNKIFKKSIRQWEPEINRYLETNLKFMLNSIQDLSFISSVTNIIIQMQKNGLKLSKPNYCKKDEKRFTAKALYNPVLAMNMAEQGNNQSIVKNNIEIDSRTGIYLLTGANNGGKSVFMCAIGLAQIMAQIGMPVPADRLDISPASSIFVILPKHDSLNRDGRFAEECRLVGNIFKKVDEYSMLLLDELFSSTDPFEALTFSEEILRAMKFIGIRGIYTTHFHALYDKIETINSDNRSTMIIDSLVAEVSGNSEERTYKIVHKPPDGKSHAFSIAQKYGISFDRLIKQDK